MAEVFLAVQRGGGGFEKLVVVKRMLSHLLEDGQFVQMFLDEARLASKLRHPNIVSILDIHRDAETFTIAMEYLQGEDLRALIRLQRDGVVRIPIPITLHVVSKVADALHHAHTAQDERGNPLRIVHRDVAPSNVIVTYDGQVKLIDFGVAKASAHSTYTRPGTVKGKYPYSSPEQIASNQLDARSDVFSLGIVLHELLTGRRLFTGDNPAATLRSVLADPIPRPSELNPAVSERLDEIVLKALERDRNARTPSARALRKQISEVLAESVDKVAPEDLAQWMRTTFADRLQKRTAVEKAAIAAARDRLLRGDSPSLLPAHSTSVPIPVALSSVSHASTPSHVRSFAQGSVPPRAPQPIVIAAPTSAWRVPLLVLVLVVLGVVATLAAFRLGRNTHHAPAPVDQGALP